MFSPFSSVKNGTFIRKTVPIFLVLCFVSTALLFSGCKNEPEETGNLVGLWTNVSGNFTTTITITNDTVAYSGNYKAEIVNDPNFEASSGVLIIKFTHYADWSGGEPSLSTDHASVGKYGALYWRDLTSSSVSLADAYKKVEPTDAFPSHTMFNTLEEAQATFTTNAVSDYINWSITSPYTK
jgi:hypothetical protein